MSDIAIEVKDLVIEYRPLRNISFVKTFMKKTEKKEKVVTAVKGISFSVEKGKILGVVGKNGSGKSTLLRAIAGIFQPDSGTIDLKTNSVSLMSIGVGFNDQMTGRKNIILSGMLLGFSEKEMLDKMDGIIEFAELGEFIDMPVRTYSSGMHSKLAFAITSNLETDILLVDEVLSVGDAKFKEKSLTKMKELILDESKTVIIVSHDLNTLLSICDEILWINDGEIFEKGKPQEVIEKYREFMRR